MQLLAAEKLALGGRVERQPFIVSCQTSKHGSQLCLCDSGHFPGKLVPIQLATVSSRWHRKTDPLAQELR